MKKPEKKETEKKGKKFHTLRHQISMIFTAVLLFSIVTITVINGFFLEKYYISQKVEMLLQAEATLSKLDIEAILENGDVSVADEKTSFKIYDHMVKVNGVFYAAGENVPV